MAAIAIAVFANTLSMGFVWDDHVIVSSNPRITSLAGVPSMFAGHAFSGAGDLAARHERVVQYYRPLWTASLALDYAFWKLRPLGYHLTSVLLHAAASLCVWLLARSLIADPPAALLAALLFAVHPAHSEAVAWVSSSNEVLAGLFVFAAMLFYVRFRRSGARRHALGCGIAFAAALLSKETAVMLPVLALLYELMPASAERPRRWAGPVILGAIALAYLGLRHALVHNPPEAHPLSWRLITAPVLAAHYLGLLLWPFALKVFYPIGITESPASAAFLVSLAVLAAVAAVAIWSRRRAPAVFLGLGWTLVALLPVSGVVALLWPALMADRYLYIPSAGACLALGGGLAWVARRGSRARVVLVPAALVVLAVFAGVTVLRNRLWRDDLTLMTRMVHDAPDVALAHMNLAVYEERSGDSEQALPELERAARLDPENRQIRGYLGNFYQGRGRYADAEREYRAALALKDDDVDSRYGLGCVLIEQGRAAEGIGELEKARRLRPGDPDVHVGLAAGYQAEGRLDDAAREYQRALELAPNSARAHHDLGMLEQRRGQVEDARRELAEACRLDPASAENHFDLAGTLSGQGHYVEAERELRAAIALRPDWAQAHSNLGIALAMQRRMRQALPELEEAARLDPGNAEIQSNLDVARRAASDTSARPTIEP